MAAIFSPPTHTPVYPWSRSASTPRSPSREIVDLAGDEPQALAVGVADHGRDEALEVEIDGDAHVYVVVDDEVLAVDAGVDVRVRLDRVAERTHDEREVREGEPF